MEGNIEKLMEKEEVIYKAKFISRSSGKEVRLDKPMIKVRIYYFHENGLSITNRLIERLDNYTGSWNVDEDILKIKDDKDILLDTISGIYNLGEKKDLIDFLYNCDVNEQIID